MAHFAASIDDVETNRSFAESLGLDFPILSDPEKAAAKAYGVLSEDEAYARRWTFTIGRDGRILHVDKDVQPGTHGADVAARLESLGVAARE